MYVCMYMSVVCMCACMTEKGIRSHCRWVLGFEVRTSVRARSPQPLSHI